MKLIYTSLLMLSFWMPLAHARFDAFPSSIYFFNVEVGGGLGQQRSINVYNRSTERNRITVNNYCYGDFRITNWCYGELSPGGSCRLDVRFQPHRVGHQSCTIWLQDSEGSSHSISVSGQGVDRR